MADAVVERDREVRAIAALVDGLTAGRGGTVAVEAVSGMGKTTLLRHARDRAVAAGVTVLSARGAELEADFAFGVVRQLFEPALPADPAERRRLFDGTAAELLFTDDEVDGTPSAASLYPLLTGLHRLLANLARERPVAVLVDDVQWADAPSLRFLGFLLAPPGSNSVIARLAAFSASSRRPAHQCSRDNQRGSSPARETSPAARRRSSAVTRMPHASSTFPVR